MNYSKTAAFLLLLTLAAANFLHAQTRPVSEPTKQEKLLNGLKVLIWNEPKAEKVSLRLRIHSGSAFDQKDKMGTMALLADILFPDEQTRRFFEEDLEGSLEVASNYDYIQISATAKADEFLTILETISTAVSNPPITQENFVKVRDARLKTVEEMQKNPAYIADRAVAKRLLGDFPYGRPQAGTPESLKLIERADLLTAKDRFFTADNATLTITGNVKPDFAYMAARRMFGAWKKADKLVPATFRQPDEPNTEKLVIEMANLDKPFPRTALNAPARNSKDFYPMLIAISIFPKFDRYKINYEAHLLRGIITFVENKHYSPGTSPSPENLNFHSYQEFKSKDKEIIGSIGQEPLEQVRAKLISNITTNPADAWLDVDTFKLVSVKDELQKINAVTVADVQRAAESLLKSTAVSVVVSKPAEK